MNERLYQRVWCVCVSVCARRKVDSAPDYDLCGREGMEEEQIVRGVDAAKHGVLGPDCCQDEPKGGL